VKSVFWKRTAVLIAGTIGAWLGVRFLLPVALPFLLGALLAIAAEPLVSLGERQLKLSRSGAAGIGVSLSLLLLAGVLAVLGGLAMRQLGSLTRKMPDMATALDSAKNALLAAADNAPERVRALAQRAVRQTFEDSTAAISGITGKLPGAISAILSSVGSSALAIGTGVVAAFLISARLPRLKALVREKLPSSLHEKYLPALKRFRHSLWLWCKAQGKLALVTWGIVTAGFLLLGIEKAPLWAGLVALVDAVPVLGTGTVLVPWAVVCFLQKNTLRGAGLLAIYAVAALTRTVLEPRVVGKQLGLDPLLTLVAMYAGFRLWGILGLFITPILTSAVKSVLISE